MWGNIQLSKYASIFLGPMIAVEIDLWAWYEICGRDCVLGGKIISSDRGMGISEQDGEEVTKQWMLG